MNHTISHGHTVRVNGKRTRSTTYVIWMSMRQRCGNKRHRHYARYGGRGITVCERWSGTSGFASFLLDMGERPEGLSIDRIDNDKGYSPENCRWVTASEQIQNSSKAKLTPELVQEIRGRAEHGEMRLSISARFGVHVVTVGQIVSRKTWSNIP